ncbi:bifunctional folylpolyglutamate synthase/dihydrofolate synthase [Hyphobacterium marinum]|uniref:bifunctional folylpolyglutamate synthase/dihydrofolate synthase n=1 Tax=Hyphobacterium marinum TaxID=3116574 RepID=UPI0035A10A19
MSLPPSRLEAALARLAGLHPKKIDLSLGRLERLLEALGRPQDRLPPTAHVAGTNGKGSVCAYLKAIAEARGERVHAYASPHLVRFNERITLAGKMVSDRALLDAFARCEAANKGAPITFFEITTAAAFLLFSETPADRLILEVGLGGRYDATNVIARPVVTAITPVSLDHQDFLGDTLSLIAPEKAGILKAHIPAVIGPQPAEAEEAILRIAEAVGAPTALWGRDYRAYSEHDRLVYEEENLVWDLPRPSLIGEHQIVNAGIAIAAARAMNLPETAVRDGLTRAEWPARLQRLKSGPLFDIAARAGAELWLDGGHNPAAGVALSRAMADLESRDPRPLVLVCGFSPNKDAAGYLAAFAGLARRVVAVAFASGRNGSAPADVIASAAQGEAIDAVTAGSLSAAIRNAAEGTPPPRILICGSLYLAGEVLALSEGIRPQATPG